MGRPLVGIARSRNLLRNSNFSRKSLVVNQKGRDTYEGSGYGIDGWKSTGSKSVQTLEEDGWVIHDTDGGLGQYQQVIEDAEATALNGVELTASILVDIRTGGPFQFGLFSSVYHAMEAAPLSAGIHLLTHTETMTDITSTLQYFISPRATNAKVIACQLEPGDRQTLAHKDTAGNWVLNNPLPNRALELLRCQQYFNVARTSFGTQSLSTAVSDTNGMIGFPFFFPTAMRCVPAVSFTGTLRVHGQGQDFQNVESIMYTTVQDNIVNVFVGGLQPLTTYTLDGHPSVELYFDSNP